MLAPALDLVVKELAAAPAVLACLGELADEPLGEFEPPAEGDLLIEGFERDEWAPWRVEGDAFGKGPLRADRAHTSASELRAVGEYLVNSYSTHRSDKNRGRLIGPPFVVNRRFLHFRVGGGSMEGVRVELWHDGEPRNAMRGSQANRMDDAAFDLTDLLGQEVHLEIVDDTEESWGQLGADQFVLSDYAEAKDLDAEPWTLGNAAREQQLATVAARNGIDVARLEIWSDWADQALVREGGRQRAPLERSALAEVFDAREAPALPLSDGPLFERIGTSHPQLRLGANGARFETGGLWVEDLAWEDLRTADGHELDPSKRNWEQAGRTLVLPTHQLQEGVLVYLARGAADVFVEINSHRMLQGPLHNTAITGIDTGGEWQLVRHDLARYAGSRVQIEFTPRADGQAFALAGVREGMLRGRPPAAGANPLARLSAGPRDWTTAQRNDLIRGLESDLDQWVEGERILEWPSQLLQLAIARGALVEPLAAWREAEQRALEGARFESRTALSLMDTRGVDEALLARGQIHAAGDDVPRRSLEAFGATRPRSAGSGRLELARELIGDENPLVRRVAVNRIWHHLFGRGLVATVDDMGVMGMEPSHPELLDYLSQRFVNLEWSQKALIRELVLSATYRQASAVGEAAEREDPQNLLLSHAPIRRVTAEALRDGLLYASGELVEEREGPSVPVHLTAFLEGRGRPGTSGPLDGNGRRSLYLAVRRNFLQPLLMVFDFPVPATTIGRRSNSNVPAQALALLNDPFIGELCERWAERLMQLESAEARLDDIFARSLARAPREAERRALMGYAKEHGVDQAGTWADLAHVVINMKEFRFLD